MYQTKNAHKSAETYTKELRDYIKQQEELALEDKAEILRLSTAWGDASNAAIVAKLEVESKVKEQMDLWISNEAPKIRADALSRQKMVRTGYTSEHFAPFAIPLWPVEDYFRVGGSVDYLVLPGADAVRDKRQDEVDEVVLLDIKTGKADLNTVQRRIRNAVIEGRVAFATYNMDTQEMKRWELGQKRAQKETL